MTRDLPPRLKDQKVIPISLFLSQQVYSFKFYILFLRCSYFCSENRLEQNLNLMFVPKRQHGTLDASLTYNKTKVFKASDCSAER